MALCLVPSPREKLFILPGTGPNTGHRFEGPRTCHREATGPGRSIGTVTLQHGACGRSVNQCGVEMGGQGRPLRGLGPGLEGQVAVGREMRGKGRGGLPEPREEQCKCCLGVGGQG